MSRPGTAHGTEIRGRRGRLFPLSAHDAAVIRLPARQVTESLHDCQQSRESTPKNPRVKQTFLAKRGSS